MNNIIITILFITGKRFYILFVLKSIELKEYKIITKRNMTLFIKWKEYVIYIV